MSTGIPSKAEWDFSVLVAERDCLRAVNGKLLEALNLINTYPNIRKYVGTDVHDVVLAAIKAAEEQS